jgi:peptidyl-prolyl cis-trans isomerase C
MRLRAAWACVLVTTVVGVSACQKKANPNAAGGTTLSTANGQQVDAGLFAAYVQQTARSTPERLDAATRARLLQDLANLQTAADNAARDQDAATRYAVELQRLELLSRAGATKAGVFAEPSQADLEAAYQAFIAERPASEFHVAHILVPTENIALDVIRRLSEGGNSAAIAAKDSGDDSKTRGGDIGWIYPGKLPKPFTDAVQGLEVGQYTRQPVQTAYGWHVIKLLETRGRDAPSLESVRAQLVVNLQQERYRAYLAGSKPSPK